MTTHTYICPHCKARDELHGADKSVARVPCLKCNRIMYREGEKPKQNPMNFALNAVQGRT